MTDNKDNNIIRRRKKALRTLASAGIVAALALAVAAFLLRDQLFGPDPAERYADIEPFTYETGSDQCFAICGDGLAIASTTGLQLTNADGETVARSIFSMSVPAVDASEELAVFFDVGGTQLRTAGSDGTVTELEAAGTIITADMAENGYFAVCTEETGYRGLVTVYGSALLPIYRWYSGSGWLIKAAVAPGGGEMAAICVESSGTVLHIFRLDSQEEKAAVTFTDKLYFDVIWLSGTRLCLVGEDDMVFIDSSGQEQTAASFQGQYLEGYSASGGGISVFLSEYLTGGTGSLISYDSQGSETALATTDKTLVSLSRSGSRTLALYTDCCVLYSSELLEEGSAEDVLGVRSALLRSDGRALLLSAYSAHLRDIS